MKSVVLSFLVTAIGGCEGGGQGGVDFCVLCGASARVAWEKCELH